MTDKSEKGERIAKRIARSGLCSRRDAERLIEEGLVTVNGEALKSPALNVTEDSVITVNGKPLPKADEPRLWRYHKPTGVITTTRDPQGRPTVFQKLPPEMPRVISIGRLDFNTEGLLLLTNDGDLARHMELPKNAWIRHYRVRVYGAVDPAKLVALEKGITLSGVHYESIKAEIDGSAKKEGADVPKNVWLNVSIREGKNREVRKVMEHLNLQVTRLIRVAYGTFQLGKLPRGAVEEVPRRVLRDALGKFLEEIKK